MTASTTSSLLPLLLFFCLLGAAPLSERHSTAAAATVAAVVDLAADRHDVSDQVYGINTGPWYTAPTAMLEAGLLRSTRMGGGDPTSAYNWRFDADNAGADWWFTQRARAADGQPHSTVAFVNASIAGGADTVFVNVGILGQVAVSRSDCYSFPMSRFPDQRESFQGGDMGDGVLLNGSTVGSVYGPQLHCYTPSSPQDIVDLVAFLVQQFGLQAVEQHVVIELDNEPEWWSWQHQDVHPAYFTYDELWTLTHDYAAAVKAVYPNVRISAFVMAGWAALWCSGIDAASYWNQCMCSPAAPPYFPCSDYRAHDEQYLWPWLLQQVNAHKLATGVQLIDYVDLHWYSFLNDLNNDSDPSLSAQLLNQTRNLYDPTFTEPSHWIDPLLMPNVTDAKPALLPLLRSWLRQHAPNCSLLIAMSEYNFGNDGISTTALTSAEAFAIMGKESLAVSHRFAQTTASDPAYAAYLFHLNYDGQHHQVTGQSTHAAAQADLNDLTIYTQHDDSSQRLFIKIFNKVLTEPTTVKLLISHVQLTSGNDTSTGSVYQFQALSGQPVQLRKAGSVTMQQQVEAEATAVLTVSLPVRTATLLVFPFVQLATAGTGAGGLKVEMQ